MAAETASTWWGTLWVCSLRWQGNTWKRSWTNGPRRTYSPVSPHEAPCFYNIEITCFYRGVHGHTEGSRPWAWAENNIEELMANVVGKSCSSGLLLFYHWCSCLFILFIYLLDRKPHIDAHMALCNMLDFNLQPISIRSSEEKNNNNTTNYN